MDRRSQFVVNTANPRLPVLERLDRATLLTMGREWDTLVAATPRPSPCMAWSWVGAWLDTLGADDDLEVVAARDPDDGSFVGLAPFAVTTVRRRGMRYRALRLLGTGPVSATGLDLPIAGPFGDIIAPVLWDAVCRYRRWDVLDLSGVASDGVLAKLVLRRRSDPASAERTVVRSLDPARVDETADVDGGLGRLVVDHTDLDATFDSLVIMTETARSRRSRRAPLAHPSVLGFYREAARRALSAGRLRLWRLDHDGRILGALYGMRFADVVVCHSALVHRGDEAANPIRRLVASAVRAAAEEGVRAFVLPPGVEWPGDAVATGHDLRIRRPAGSWGRLLWLSRRVAKAR